MNKKVIKFDVMMKDKFIKTFTITLNQWKVIEESYIKKYVEDRLPSLRNKTYNVIFY